MPRSTRNRVGFHGLQPAGTVDVGDRGYLSTALWADRYDLQHEWDIVIGDEPVANRLAQDRWKMVLGV